PPRAGRDRGPGRKEALTGMASEDHERRRRGPGARWRRAALAVVSGQLPPDDPGVPRDRRRGGRFGAAGALRGRGRAAPETERTGPLSRARPVPQMVSPLRNALMKPPITVSQIRM